MKERKSLRVFDLTTEQYIYNVDSLFQQFGLKDKVADLIIDSEKHCWFLTPGSSVYMCTMQRQSQSNRFVGMMSLWNTMEDYSE